MTIQEVNEYIRNEMARQLQKAPDDLGEDLAIGYRNWVQQVVRRASDEYKQEHMGAEPGTMPGSPAPGIKTPAGQQGAA